VVETLGGRSVFKKTVSTPAGLSEAIREGLPYGSLEALLAKLQVSRSEGAAALRFSERTLARRKKGSRLSPEESDRVLRVARLFAFATRILENEDNAARWFSEPNRALRGKTPLESIDTEIGSREAEEVLWRIAHGMFS
jgi:putative toxin-antitoxin system antitoxin component (TIGR02293 family)